MAKMLWTEWCLFSFLFIKEVLHTDGSCATRPASSLPCPSLSNFQGSAAQKGGLDDFWIDTHSDRYTVGTPLSVTIAGSTPFRGFVLQARSTVDGAAIGTWASLPAGVTTFSCLLPADAVTHANYKDKVNVRIVWTSNVVDQPFQFVANVRENTDTPWVELASDVIQPERRCNCSSPSQPAWGAGRPGVQYVQGSPRVARHRRDADEEGQETENNSMVTMVERTTKKPSTGLSDKTMTFSESLFLLATIVGAYVGMYTVFAFLIL